MKFIIIMLVLYGERREKKEGMEGKHRGRERERERDRQTDRQTENNSL